MPTPPASKRHRRSHRATPRRRRPSTFDGRCGPHVGWFTSSSIATRPTYRTRGQGLVRRGVAGGACHRTYPPVATTQTAASPAAICREPGRFVRPTRLRGERKSRRAASSNSDERLVVCAGHANRCWLAPSGGILGRRRRFGPVKVRVARWRHALYDRRDFAWLAST